MIEVFQSPTEQDILNTVLLLPDLSSRSKALNISFQLSCDMFSVSFTFNYYPRDDPDIRTIKSVSVTKGTVLGGTSVVVTLRSVIHS